MSISFLAPFFKASFSSEKVFNWLTLIFFKAADDTHTESNGEAIGLGENPAKLFLMTLANTILLIFYLVEVSHSERN